MPIKGMARQKYLELKFGGKENAKKTYEDIYKAGLINDIHFQFDKITITPNSFYSHKLLALAYEFKKQTAVVETIFYEYFIEGVDIGNIDEIIRIAQQHSIKKDNIQQYLESEEDNKSLLAEETHARSIGVTGLPCFIINKAFVVFGAQDKQYFSNIFRDISSG
jgi:predicted DsbA family dithiol-disulfide isomerase